MCFALVAAVVTGTTLWSVEEPEPPLPEPRTAQIDVLDGKRRQERTLIDATLYSPVHTPAPAVVVTHGFGQDKNAVADQARALARQGFTVLTYSSRGFGASTGRIGFNAPEYEVADARQIIDWLARQPEVLRDGDRDPRVGFTGQSYGGALSLLVAGTDHRVDAIAPLLTYNDLEQALLPNAATSPGTEGDTPARGSTGDQGVLKRAWASLIFASGITRGASPAEASGPESPGGPREFPEHRADDPAVPARLCGRFTPEVCAAYTEIAQTGSAGPEAKKLLERVSPKSVTQSIKAPTLLVQGEQDTLFGLDQADANMRQIAQSGTRVKALWYAGGHDGEAPSPHVRGEVARWFAFHLGGVPPVPDPGTGFAYDIAGQRRRDGERPVRTVGAPAYPGIGSEPTARFDLPLRGKSTVVVNPPGGAPAATSSLPGVDAERTSSMARDWPGQVARFSGPVTDHRVVISGVPRTTLTVSSVPGEPATDEAVLFAKLYDVSPEGNRTLLGNAVSPLRVSGLSSTGGSKEVEVALPGVVHSLQAGHRLELAVATTDQMYEGLEQPAVYRVGLGGDRAVSVPSVPGRDTGSGTIPVTPLLGISAIALLGLVIWGLAALHRRNSDDVDPDLTDTPLVLSGVSKSFTRTTHAVQELSLRVERGQIVGLLGPNGAGKTTTLGMLLGVVHPTGGTVRLFGHRVFPGAPVLTRTGSLVEGPGFVPHLSGADNLRTFWASTGRPLDEAHLDEVLRIAGLDESQLHRKVRTYTHGMRQRLAIAQAMMGLPELLVLDEPVNRLDPPQIRALRAVLRRYADSGRAVLLSSHLLSEVEQTCTHVAVMHEGKLVTSGPIEELVAAHSETTFRVDDAESAADALYRLDGLGKVETDAGVVHAELGEHTPATAVTTLVSAGIAVTGVERRQRLEDAFLRLVGKEGS